MVSNITNTTETSSFPLQDKRAQTQEQVRKEQESFQKLIEQKAKAAQEAMKAEKTKEGSSQKTEDLKTSKSESAQNAASAPKDVAQAPSHTETPSTPAQASAQNNAKPAQSKPQSAQSAEAKPQNNAPEMPTIASSAAMLEGMKDGEINEGAKTLADVKSLGDEKALKVGDMKLESSTQNNAQNAQNTASTQAKVANSIKAQKESLESMNEAKPEGMSTQALLAQKAAQGSLKAPAMASLAVDPLAQALKEVTTRDLAARKMSKAGGIEYKKEKGGEKIAVIERGRSLPKNITEANIRNAKRDEAYREVFEKFGITEETKEDSLASQALNSESNKKKL